MEISSRKVGHALTLLMAVKPWWGKILDNKDIRISNESGTRITDDGDIVLSVKHSDLPMQELTGQIDVLMQEYMLTIDPFLSEPRPENDEKIASVAASIYAADVARESTKNLFDTPGGRRQVIQSVADNLDKETYDIYGLSEPYISYSSELNNFPEQFGFDSGLSVEDYFTLLKESLKEEERDEIRDAFNDKNNQNDAGESSPSDDSTDGTEGENDGDNPQGQGDETGIGDEQGESEGGRDPHGSEDPDNGDPASGSQEPHGAGESSGESSSAPAGDSDSEEGQNAGGATDEPGDGSGVGAGAAGDGSETELSDDDTAPNEGESVTDSSVTFKSLVDKAAENADSSFDKKPEKGNVMSVADGMMGFALHGGRLEDRSGRWAKRKASSNPAAWGKVLKAALSRALTGAVMSGQADMSYAKRNPLQEEDGPIMMGLIQYPPSVVVMLDSSPTMKKYADTTVTFFSDIVVASTLSSGTTCDIVSADTEITWAGKGIAGLRKKDKAFLFDGKNRGTDLAPVIMDIAKRGVRWKSVTISKPDILIVFTDGKFEWPYKDKLSLPTSAPKLIFACTEPMSYFDRVGYTLPRWVKEGKNFIYVPPVGGSTFG